MNKRKDPSKESSASDLKESNSKPQRKKLSDFFRNYVPPSQSSPSAANSQQKESKESSNDKPEIPGKGYNFFVEIPNFLESVVDVLGANVVDVASLAFACKAIHKIVTTSKACSMSVFTQQLFWRPRPSDEFFNNYRAQVVAECKDIAKRYEEHKHLASIENPSDDMLLPFFTFRAYKEAKDARDMGSWRTSVNIWESRTKFFSVNFALQAYSLFKSTPIYQLYSLFIPLNDYTTFLVDVHLAWKQFSRRPRNEHELSMFKVPGSPSLPKAKPAKQNEFPIVQLREFEDNMDKYFFLQQWKDLIPWDSFVLAGGSVLTGILKSLCYSHEDQDLDLFYRSQYITKETLKDLIHEIVAAFAERFGKDNIQVQKEKRLVTNIHVKFSTPQQKVLKFQFVVAGAGTEFYTTNSVLYNFDLSCCQVLYDGRRVLCTPAFIQSVATGTMVNFKLINNEYVVHKAIPRITKYLGRGFQLVIPAKFNQELLDADLSKAEMPTYGKYEEIFHSLDVMELKNDFVEFIVALNAALPHHAKV